LKHWQSMNNFVSPAEVFIPSLPGSGCPYFLINYRMNKGFAGFPPMQEGYSAVLVCKTKYQGGSFDYLQHEYNACHLLTIRGKIQDHSHNPHFSVSGIFSPDCFNVNIILPR